MEEKKVTKISLSTFFLILALIAICVMGGLLYRSNLKTTEMISDQEELQSKIAKLESEMIEKREQLNAEPNKSNSNLNIEKNSKENNVSNNITFSSLTGEYLGNAKVETGTTPDGDTKVSLYLFNNGIFIYNNRPGWSYLDSDGRPGGPCEIGYYTFNNNELILHKVVSCGNDIGRSIISKTSTIKINNDNSLEDSELNVNLKKTSNSIKKEYDVISSELKNALDNNSLR